jgi:hypothetical protein
VGRREGTHLHEQVHQMGRHGRVELFDREAEMNAHRGYRSFAIKAGLILAGGLVIMLGFTFAIVLAASTSTPTGPPTPDDYGNGYNIVGSFGSVGYPPLKLAPTESTPSFVKKPLEEKRGVILLVYVKGAPDDEEMLSYFNSVKSKYASQAAFFSFEARDVSELGDVMTQLEIDQPPALAVISGDGSVYQEYTGWIGKQVMEQVVANALRK